ncbi:MAG: PKD domain-containing protein [Sphingobacteriaceae bacterium]|nr:PKD domain-containing protein [Sphingobacteriaceae bacterium]
MKKLLIIVCTFVLAISSCKKKEFPQNVTEEPAFYISANIDGTPVSLKAGAFGYYMYSSYVQDTNGMYTFVAEVKPNGCGNTCANSLKIELNDDKTSVTNGTSNINSSIKVGDCQFANTATVAPTLIGYAVSFRSMYNKPTTNVNYMWNFDDAGSLSNEANPTHTYTTAGIKNVNLAITETTSSTTSSIENPIKVTISPVAVKTRILTPLVNGNTISFSNSTNGGTAPPAYSYKWDFGDYSPVSNSANPSHTYSVSGMYKVKLIVWDQTGDTAKHNFNINTSASNLAATNFSVVNTTPLYFTTATNLLSKVKITYVDASGKIYYSNLQSQVGAGNIFTITSAEEYKANEHGQTTKKLKVTFNCKLYNGTSSSVSLTNGEAVIAVSYK